MSSVFAADPAAGVFETLLVADGRPVELDAHLGRLAASAAELFDSALPAGSEALVAERARPLELGRLRLSVAPSPDGLLCEVVTAAVPRAAVFPGWERAAELRPFEVAGGLGAHKWSDRSLLASLESGLPEACLALLLDREGEVLEASRANVFMVDGEALVTPPADGRILPGVARGRAIETARSLGIEVCEEALRLERLTSAREVFLTGSVRGIEPVRALAETTYDEPGSVVRAIARDLERLWIGRGAASWAAAP